MADAKKDAAPAAAPAAPPAKSSKLMPILVGLNSLLLLGVLGFMAYSMMHKPAAAPPEHVAEETHEETPAEPAKEEKGGAKEEGKKEEGKKAEGKKAEGKKEILVAGAGPGPMVRMTDFVVHLRNPDMDRYARITFDAEVVGESDKEMLESHMPRVRDAFIGYLSDRTVEELGGSEGLSRTKDALQQRLRELVPDARVRALYISDFVVQ